MTQFLFIFTVFTQVARIFTQRHKKRAPGTMSGRRDMDVYPYLLACVVFELCYIECTDEFRMTGNFGRGKIDVYMQ